MKQSPKSIDQTTKQPNQAVFLLIMTAFSTTWRAFVPTIGSTIVGVMLDNTLDTAPILTSVMIIIGCAISVLLIIKQIRDIKK